MSKQTQQYPHSTSIIHSCSSSVVVVVNCRRRRRVTKKESWAT